ncbi:MAG: cupin domain-containing protein [Thermaerobacter sp.]|nr:cupin domain-containing protein [Thermaerobacter sp.]
MKRAMSDREFHARLEAEALGPLWTVLADTLTTTPRPREVAYKWRWPSVRPLLYEALQRVTAEEAERRVLVLRNPGLPGPTACTETLYAGIQIIGPGEVARTHRHTPNALRFIMEGSGAFSTVDGERIAMDRGDLVTTPTWTWHDHGNDGDAPVVWLDGLDIPLVESLSGMFFEPSREREQRVTRAPGDSRARYAMGLRPAYETFDHPYSPVLSYPYNQARAALAAVARGGGGSPYDGVLMEYTSPLSGGPVLPTMDAYLQWIPPGASLQPIRRSSSVVYLGVEGQGTIMIDGVAFGWEVNDVVVVPSWAALQHVNGGHDPAVLFSFSNAPVLKPFGLYREADA